MNLKKVPTEQLEDELRRRERAKRERDKQREPQYCDDCTHFGGHQQPACLLRHNVKFRVPATMSEAARNEWGWVCNGENCKDYGLPESKESDTMKKRKIVVTCDSCGFTFTLNAEQYPDAESALASLGWNSGADGDICDKCQANPPKSKRSSILRNESEVTQ